MKKKLLAALLVLVMLLSVMPLAAYAEDEGSGEADGEILEEVQENSETPKESQTAETPASETPSTKDAGTNELPLSEDNGDDEGANPVAEDDTPEEVVDKPVVVSEDETETSSNAECPYPDFKGNWAEVVANCESGTHTDYFDNDTKVMISDGLCDVCGYHDVDGINHIIDENEIEITETTHSYHCKYDGCDYEWSEEHMMKWTFTNASGHSGYCTGCSYTVDNVAHTFDEDGVCTVCGYEQCTEHVVGTEGYEKHICQICGVWVTTCIDVDHDCKCDICGESHHAGTGGYDENEHWFACDYCDYEYRERHYDTDGDGICDYCFYGCNHESVQYESYGYYGHFITCTACYHYLGSDEHTYGEDGSCTLCGFKPCDPHTFDESKTGWERHRCTECNYIEACSDTDGDCICDVCGEECHYLYDTADSLHYDSDEHWFTCGKCGKEYTRGAHYDYYTYTNGLYEQGSDGLCDVCGYDMSGSGSSADDSGLDDVPKTGDASLALAGLSVLFAACPILKKFVI